MDREINRSQFIYQQKLYDRIELINGSQKSLQLMVKFIVEAAFDDLFEVRGAKRQESGSLLPHQIKTCFLDQARTFAVQEMQQWFVSNRKMRSDNEGFNRFLHTSGRRSHSYTEFPGSAYPFGRDSMITAIQTLIYNPQFARNTLRTFLCLEIIVLSSVDKDFN